MNNLIVGLIVMTLFLQLNCVLSKCCWPIWVRERKDIVENYPLKHKVCHEDNYCYYQSCGLSGIFDNYYFNHSIPLDVSLSKQEFDTSSYFCGQGACLPYLFGCHCFSDCQTDITQDPRIKCTLYKRSGILVCHYENYSSSVA